MNFIVDLIKLISGYVFSIVICDSPENAAKLNFVNLLLEGHLLNNVFFTTTFVTGVLKYSV